MSRQSTSILLALALGGATALTACTSQQRVRSSSSQERSARTTQVRGDQTRSRTSSDQRRSGAQRRASSDQQVRDRPAPAPTTRPAPAPRPTPTASRPAPAPTPTMRDGLAWSKMAYPTGDTATSALLVEKGMPRQVRMNTPFEYQLCVKNLTNNSLNDVVLTDKLGANFSMSGSSPEARTGADGAAMWTMGTLAPGERRCVTVTASATAEGSIDSCATISYSSMLCAAIPVVSPKLRLTKTGPAEVSACDEIVYNFEVSNTGTGSVDNVVINDPLPAGLMSADGGRTITLNAGTLSAGQTKKMSARVRADRTGTFANSATASAGGGMSASSGTVNTVVRKPVLSVTKSCPGTSFIGKNISYEVTVMNRGDGTAKGTVVEDTLPAGTSFVGASDGGRSTGGSVVWNVGDLAANASKKMTVTVMPNAAGTYRNSVSARANCADPVSDACETVVTGIPAILLEVVDLKDPVRVGNQETYVITVTNQGSAEDTNIRIECVLEGNQTYVSSSGATRGSSAGQRITFAPLPSLAPKARAEFRVVVNCVSAGDVRFTVIMNSDQLTRPVQETEATNQYE